MEYIKKVKINKSRKKHYCKIELNRELFYFFVVYYCLVSPVMGSCC